MSSSKWQLSLELRKKHMWENEEEKKIMYFFPS
jgi:hypothetical protein